VSGAPARTSTQVGSGFRRARAIPLNIALWALIWAIVVVIVHSLTVRQGKAMGPYWSGLISLTMFVVIGWYSVRKRDLWFSVKLLKATSRILPAGLQNRLVALDRVETWRGLHTTVGIIVILPLWWHLQTGLMSPLEMMLAITVALLLLSGIFGIAVQNYLPKAVQKRTEHEVRRRDANARIEAIYVAAEEKVLGHGDEFTHTYLSELRPILNADRVPTRTLLWATLRGVDAGPEQCAHLYPIVDTIKKQVKDENILKDWDTKHAPVWKELVDLVVDKIDLEQNEFNLHLSTDWLAFHVVVALATIGLLIFHVGSVLYFYGM
jgi:hypothetical protein